MYQQIDVYSNKIEAYGLKKVPADKDHLDTGDACTCIFDWNRRSLSFRYWK